MTSRFAIVGSGWVSNAIAPDFAACEGVELTTLVSRSRETSHAFADKWSIPTVLTIDEISDADVDVVYVATPHDSHRAIATAALEAGKHVLVEKAFAMNATEAGELIALAKSRGLFLMEAMWMRFNPAIRRAHELLDAGAIGEPRTLYASFGFPVPAAVGSRLWDPSRAGGSLLDQGVYPLALADLVFGAPDTVEATGSHLGYDGDDAGVDTEVAALLGYAGGQQAIVSTSIRSVLPLSAAIGGSEGLIELEEAFWSDNAFRVRRPGRDPERFELPKEGNGYIPMLRAVNEAIQNGWTEHPLSPLDATVRVMEVVDRVRERINGTIGTLELET